MSNINGYAQDSITLNGIVTDDYTTSIIDLTGDNISLTGNNINLTSTTLLYNGLPLVTSAGIETLNSKTQNITASPNQTEIVGNLNVDTIKTDSISDVLSSSSIELNVGGINITSGALNFNGDSVISATGNSTQYIMGDGSLLTYSANSGNSNFYLYKSHTNTPAPPHDNGFVYYNSAVQASATIIYISHLSDDNIDVEIFFNNINQINDVYLQDRNDSTNYIRYNITGQPIIVVGSHIQIPVSLIVAGGSGGISFGINHNILLSFFSNNIEVDTRLSAVETKTQNMDSVLNQTGINGNLTVYGTNGVTAQKFITVGALSTEFIKGNGSLDGNTYATTTITDGLLSKKLFLKNQTVGILLGVPYVDICPTVIGNLTIPANSVKQGDIYALTIEGAYTTTSNNARPLTRITIGGVLFTNVDIFPSTSGSFGFKFILKFSFWTIGAVSTGSAITTLETGSLSNPVINSQMAFLPGGLPTFNTTISNTVLIEARSTSATITVNLVPYFLFMSKI